MDFSLFGRLGADLTWQFLPGEPVKVTGGNKTTLGMKLIPITINSLSILLVKTAHFLVVNFIKGTAIYVNLRLELNCFSSAKFR